MKKTTENDMVLEADSQSALKPIENSKWIEPLPIEHISEEYREEAIKLYNKYINLLDGMNSKFFVSYFGGKSLIYRISPDKNEPLKPFSHYEFLNHYGVKTIKTIVDIKKGKPIIGKVHHFCEWLKNENRRQYNLGIKFYPGQIPGLEQEAKQYYNSWRGFPLEGKQGEFPKIEYHLKHVWCRDNIEHYNYLMAWLADIIQDPAKKKGTALVVKGLKGAGKSIIVEELLNKIFGYLYIVVSQSEQVVGKFNLHLHGKLLLVLEEAVWAGDKSAEGTLKSMITANDFVLEGKGTNAEKSESFFRMIFLSNEKQAVPASKDERRYFALEVSAEYLDNIPYFKALEYEIHNGGAEAFMYHLQNLDISNINLRVAPRTEALFQDILAKMETVERFLYDLLHQDIIYFNKLERYYPLWENKVTKYDIFRYFETWEKSIASKNIYLPKHDITTQAKLVREINKMMSFKDTKVKTENAYELPSKDIARKMFESQVKSKVTWLDDESDNMVDEEYERKNREMDELLGEDGEKLKRELEAKKSLAGTPLEFFAKS